MDFGHNPSNISSLVESFYFQLSEKLRADNMISVDLREDIWDGYLYLLRRAVFLGLRILILIDDIDKIPADDLTNVSWIPQMKELNTETWRNIYFIVSSSSSQFFYRYIHGRYNKYIIQPVPSLTQDERMNFLRSKIPFAEDRDLLEIIQKPDGDQFMFLHFSSKIIGVQDSTDKAISINSIPDTLKNIFQYYISKMLAHFEKDNLKDVFLLFYFCRTGVLESEIMGMLKIDLAHWLLLYRHLEPFLIRQKSGRLVLFNSCFAEYIKDTYICDEKVCKEFQEKIGNYFWNRCDPEKHDNWDGSNLYRVKDILYHLLAAEAPLDTIISILCSLSFIHMIFKKKFGRHLKSLFSRVRNICVRMNDGKSLNLIYDFSLFVERNFQHLQNFPDLTFSLALSLPDRSCVSVRENALLWQKRQKNDTIAKIICLSSILSITDTFVLGLNPCRIIFLSVLQFRGLGKCCVSVSDDGTVKLWDIDSYILIDTILQAPFSIRDISSCSFNLPPTDKIAYCHFLGDISIYSLLSKKLVIRITDSVMISHAFFSNDKSGIWVSKLNSNGIHFVSFSGLTEKENKNISASKDVPLLLKCDRILAKSFDGAKVAIHSMNYSGAIILNAVTVTEICRFNCENLDKDSLACFSVSKDMFAAMLSDHNIMVWKIDNHSRISYIKTDDLRFQDMAFSVDESMLYCGSSNGDIYMFNIHNGKMIRKVQTGSNGQSLICTASSNGKERVFLAAETKVLTCDIKSLTVSTVNNPITEKLYSDSNIILLFCSQELEYEAQKYDALSVDSQGQISIWKGKDVFKSYCLDFELDTCAFEANNQIIFGCSSSHLIVYSLCLKKILVNKPTPKSFSQLWIQYGKNHRAYWLGGLSNDEIVCWKLSGKDACWEMSDLFTKKNVSFVPNKPIYIDFERLCIRINGYCAVLNCWTGKETFVHQNKRDSVKDMLLFERNGHVSSAILLSDSIYVDNLAWSSKTGIKSMDVLDQFFIDDHGEYLLYSGRIAKPDADHENECIVNVPYGFINVIGLSPSRKRLCSLSTQGSFIKLWKMSKNRELVTLTGDNVITVWNLQKLTSSTEVPYISYPLSKSLSISSLNLSSYDSLIYLTCHGQVMVLRYVI
jgi:WD40 repeat protein